VLLCAGFVFVRCGAFLVALRWCFRSLFVFCLLLFVLLCSVIRQILSLLRFVGVGGILYRVIFNRS
jgi:hypothetical protein